MEVEEESEAEKEDSRAREARKKVINGLHTYVDTFVFTFVLLMLL